MFLSDLSSAAIIYDPGQPVLAHAAEEIRAHAGPPADRVDALEVALTAGAGVADGFTVHVDGDRITVAGESPRGALNGVYFVLEQLGIRWVRPGDMGTRAIPGRSLADGVYRESPAFARRTLILGNDALHDAWREWMEFASRNRLNSVFFHDTPPSLLSRGSARPSSGAEIAADGKGWLFERWDSDSAEIQREAARRGLTLQFGGHHLPALLSRELFDAHPDWFPLRNGARDARYNLCPTNSGAITELRTRAGDFFSRFSGASVYHLWADDILGGGWCSCSECAGLTPSDQALLATNVVAEALQQVASSSVIAHLAYHDTIAPPKSVLPAANVTALYAPRNRNYAFAIDDPECERNSGQHFSELQGLARTFSGREGALAVFEYYSDAVLYKWMDPPNLAVLPKDASAYHGAGVADFGDLAVTPRPWKGPTWHAWWFARCAWNPTADASTELRDFCAAAFEEDGPRFERLYREFDSAYRKLLDLGSLERIPRHDVLDFSDSPREALTAKASQLVTAADEFNAAVAYLPLMPAGLGNGMRTDLAAQLATINHLTARVAAWDAALDGRRDESRARLEMALFHLRALRDWDAVHGEPAYANLSAGMLRAMNWHTEQVAKLAE